MTRDRRLAWLALALTPGLGPRLAAKLLEALGAPERIRGAGTTRFATLLGPTRGPALARALARARPEPVLRRAEALGQRVLTADDPDWPRAAFEALVDPPLALFLRGRLPPPPARSVAVVGTRDAGPYGLRTARRLARALAARGVWIVSGFALGIDGEAHRGALVQAGGATLGVLGCGIDVPYPAEHGALGEEIVMRGGLLSEHPPGTRPRAGHFPRRNRVVAALAEVVVVVEAPHRSGALVTAQLALDMGRDVLVVPGPIGGSGFRGAHGLLKRGAAGLCEGPGDVLDALGIEARPGAADAGTPDARSAPAGGPALAVWAAIDETEVVDLAELASRTGLAAADVAVGVATLELDGYLARVPGLGVRRL